MKPPGSVTGFDPFAPAKRWLAVPAAARPTDGPVAIGCIDSTTLATVARLEKEWALRHLSPRPTESGGPRPRAALDDTAPDQQPMQIDPR